MNITYDIEKLKKIIDDFCILTGLAMAVIDTKFNYIYVNKKNDDGFCSKIQRCAEGSKYCSSCDTAMLTRAGEGKRPFSHICHAGLCDTSVPILKNGIVAGYIIIGRVRRTSVLDESIADRLEGYGLNRRELYEGYLAAPYLTDEQHASIVRLLSYIIFENAVEIDYDEFINRATDYIDENLSGDLSVTRLCTELFVSKNFLYKSFHSFYGKTVNSYVTDRRIKKASKLLMDTDASAYEISDAVGIENYTYFSKLFKKKTGLSPAEYRKTK